MQVTLYTLTHNALIMKDLKTVILDLEGADVQTGKGTGKPYKVGMPVQEAMKLLGLLQDMQKRLDLPMPSIPIQVIDVPAKDRQN